MTQVERAITEFFKLAKAHKIRACKIAIEAGITRVTLSNWKSGRTEPQLGAWLSAVEALGRLIKQKLNA